MILRVEKMKSMGLNYELQEKMMQTYIYDAADRVHKHGKDAINAFASGDEQMGMLMGIKRFTKHGPINAKENRQAVAEKMIAKNKYCF